MPDVIAIHGGKVYALELKAPDGRPTLTQLEAISDLNRAGAVTATTYGLDMALQKLEEWGILRGRAA